MNQPNDKSAILLQSAAAFNALTDYAVNIPADKLFLRPGNNKWSVAENIQHLIISLQRTTLLYRLPKFMIRLITGRPNRASRSYEELTARYRLKLAQGGRASGPFIPKPLSEKYTKEKLLGQWQHATAKYLKVLDAY
jgi:hypothetical protein